MTTVIPATATSAAAPAGVPDARLLALLHALADGKRLRILRALTGGEACVCELQEALDMAQSLLSHHLRVLREAGLVQDRRDGRWIHYSLVRDALEEAEAGLASLRTASGPVAPARVQCC